MAASAAYQHQQASAASGAENMKTEMAWRAGVARVSGSINTHR